MTGSRRRGALRLEQPVVDAIAMTPAANNPFDPIRFTEVRSLGGPMLDLDVAPGSQLLTEGEIAGTFFVLRGGNALLARDECPVSTLAAGDCFGELDPIAPQPQRYSIITAGPVRVLAFSSFGIGRLCDALPGVGDRLRAAIAQPPPVRAGYKTSPTRSRRATGSRTVTVR
jgi:CRP-like cAMP-binding protein